MPLWELIPGDPERRIYTPKKKFFEYAREMRFARQDACEPEHFVTALMFNIEDQAYAGYMIDVERSQGDNIVYNRLPVGVRVSEGDCETLAKKVLNLI